MRRIHLIVRAASMVVLIIGCSKHPSQTSSRMSSDSKDSEAVEAVTEQATNSAGTNGVATNDLLAIALKTHTKQAWLNELYHQIESDPNIDEEMRVNPRAGIRAIKALASSSSNQLFMMATNQTFDAEKLQQIKQP